MDSALGVPLEWANERRTESVAAWWQPNAPTPLAGAHGVFGVSLAAIAVRGRKAAGDPRVSVETANNALNAVAATSGPVLLSEAMRWTGRDYASERESIDLRRACFPLAHLQAGGPSMTVIPLPLLPLVLERFVCAWPTGQSSTAFAHFVRVLAARLDGDDFMRDRWLFQHVLLVAPVLVAASRRFAANLSAIYDEHAPAPPDAHVAHLNEAAVAALLVDAVRQRRWHTTVAYTTRDLSIPLLDALAQLPGRALRIDALPSAP